MGRLHDLADTVLSWPRGLADPALRGVITAEASLVPPAVAKALPWLLRARVDGDVSVLRLALENARRDPAGLAFEMHDRRLTWRDVDDRTSRVAHVLAARGVRRGDVVALVGHNSPEYLAWLLGISRVGAVAALVNHHLEGGPLSHAVRSSGARVALVEAGLAPALRARDDLREQLHHLVSYGDGELEALVDHAPAAAFPRVIVPAGDDYVYIYTSGTTGMPKPCRVSHARAVLAGVAAGNLLFGYQPGDKLYSVLPLYHSSAMLIGVGSCVATRTPMALRESFSASHFWSDVRRYGATCMLYIGELCRYLLNTPPSEEERDRRIRLALGNGLRGDVWRPFVERFGVRTVREFYGATEAPAAIFNLHDRVGSVGRVPLRRLSKLRVVRYDVDRDELVRDARGWCVPCGPNEPGQLIVRLEDRPANRFAEFKGYTDPEATRRKILSGAFEPGDRWFLSGDLMRFDDEGFFYFVDRIGDTYRWKGENVSTAEVAEIVGAAPGVREATVTGIAVPGMEGQCGLAAVVVEGELDLAAFRATVEDLPSYAQPRFVRILRRLDTTGTFKIQKMHLKRDGVDPTRLSDPLFVRTEEGYVPLDAEAWRRVVGGEIRL
ncbi:MAG: long-chain-acyl-CoA synthetase [Polyangiaceae bacterium]|nr:long-chain-acyl-CoA synthetase [Polyangiaceae bacterium]